MIPILVVLLIGGGVAAYFLFFMSGPAFDIIKAGIKTVEAGSFTFEISGDGNNELKGEVVFDFENKDINLLMEDEDGNVMGIYDGMAFEINQYDDYIFNYDTEEYEWESVKYYDNFDVSGMVETFFDGWEFSKQTLESKDVDWDAFFDLLEDVFGKDADDLRDETEEHVNLDKATDSMKRIFKLLADEGWLEVTLGLEVEKKDGETNYSFDVDFEKLAETIEELFADCGESDEFEDIFEEVLEELEETSDDDISVKGEIVIEDGYIIEASVRVAGDGWSDKVKIEISDIGETRLDTDELQERLDECEENKGWHEGYLADDYNYDYDYSYDYDY